MATSGKYRHRLVHSKLADRLDAIDFARDGSLGVGFAQGGLLENRETRVVARLSLP